MEMITYISLVLYMFDVVLLGTGELTKSFGIQSRMIFFGISVLAAVVLILLDLKKYLNNKYLISVLVFMVVIFIAAIRGFVGKQNTTILLSDFKGFLNFLIVFPMMAVLYKKNRVISFLKMLSLSLGVVSVLGIILAFYLQMPLEIRHWAYDFFDGYNICMITELTGRVTRIFFNSGSRLFFAGFALSIVFSLIENKRKIIWIFIASLDIFGVFISYTRSGYLAFAIGIFAFVVLILLFYRDFFKTLAIRACFVGGIVVVLIGMVSVAEKVNLVDVAINRCLFAGAEIEDTNTNVEKPSDFQKLKEAAKNWNFFKFLMIQTETNLILSNLEMMKQYADLDEDFEERELFMSKFLADHQNGVQLIEELFGESALERRGGQYDNLQWRNQKLEILHQLHIKYLKQWRNLEDENNKEKDKILNKLLSLINAISSGLKNTG